MVLVPEMYLPPLSSYPAPTVRRVVFDGGRLSVSWTWRGVTTKPVAFNIRLYQGASVTGWSVTNGSMTLTVPFSIPATAVASIAVMLLVDGQPTMESLKVPLMVVAPMPVRLINNGGSAGLSWNMPKGAVVGGFVATLATSEQTINQKVAATARSAVFPSLPNGPMPIQGWVQACSADDVSLGPVSPARPLITAGCTITQADDDGLGIALAWEPDAESTGVGQWLATLSSPETSWNLMAPAAATEAVFGQMLTGDGPFSAQVRAASADGVSLGPPSPACVPVLTRARPGSLARFLAEADYVATDSAVAVKSQFSSATAVQMERILVAGFGAMTEAVLRQSLAACAYAAADIDAAIADAAASGGLHA